MVIEIIWRILQNYYIIILQISRKSILTWTKAQNYPNRSNRPFISKPEIIGYFSVDGDRNYLANSSKLLYYNPSNFKKVYFDLDQGAELSKSDYCTKLANSESCASDSIKDKPISHLLEWITLNNAKILASEPDKWIEPNFVCSCGFLSTILCTPRKGFKSWIICAAKWRGTIYLCRFKTLEEEMKVPRKLLSWSIEFPQYVLSDHPDKAPDPSKPLVKDKDFRCVIKRRFGSHEVLFSAGIHAVCSKTVFDDPLSLEELKLVDLRTKKVIGSEIEDRLFRQFRLLDWWAPSFITGISKTLCGYRDDNGIIRNLTCYSNEQLSDMGKEFWKPQCCLDYCQMFLTDVSKSVVDECDKTVYKFEKLPYDVVKMTKLSPTSESWSEYAFLPSSFLSKMG